MKTLLFKKILLIAWAISYWSFNSFGEIITCPASEDAYIWEAMPDSKFGKENKLVIGKSSGFHFYTLIKFDLSNISQIPSNADIYDADIILTEALDGSLIGTLGVVTSYWGELYLDWNSGISYNTSLGITFYTGQSSISVGALPCLEYWIEQGNPNHGVIFIPDENTTNEQPAYYSIEGGTVSAPVLEVKYSVVNIIPDNSIPDNKIEGYLAIHSNPLKNTLHIEIKDKNAIKLESIIITNTMGQKLFQLMEKQAKGKQTINVDMSRYSPGIYYLIMTTNEDVISKKISWSW